MKTETVNSKLTTTASNLATALMSPQRAKDLALAVRARLDQSDLVSSESLNAFTTALHLPTISKENQASSLLDHTLDLIVQGRYNQSSSHGNERVYSFKQLSPSLYSIESLRRTRIYSDQDDTLRNGFKRVSYRQSFEIRILDNGNYQVFCGDEIETSQGDIYEEPLKRHGKDLIFHRGTSSHNQITRFLQKELGIADQN
ncbi:MAG: hypothetical protein OXU45_03925 [Candidatus Melainabacteria bacterium]|nr:hypothetical protein [Candidatus Melainabacteria bacterium]